MINISLPLRPRTNVRAEYLVTATSVLTATDGIPILSFTTMNFETFSASTKAVNEYSEVISKIFNLDIQNTLSITDEDEYMIKCFKSWILTSSLYSKSCECLVCMCKKYEELVAIRSYNQRRVQNNICTYCESELKQEQISALFLEIDWGNVSFENFNFEWVKNDWISFQKRQVSNPYKMSKQIEPIQIRLDGSSFGVKHQLIWAYELLHLSKLHKTKDITLHFVEKVKDLAFFTASIAKIIDPSLNIYLKGCPIVWLAEEKKVTDVTSKDIQKIKKGLLSKRKEVNVF